MMKIIETNTYGTRMGQEVLVIIKRGFKFWAYVVYWDTILPSHSKKYTISSAVLSKLENYFQSKNNPKKRVLK